MSIPILPPDVKPAPLKAQVPKPFPDWDRPRSTAPDDIRQWILQASKHLDVSPSSLALKAGLAASTVNRFVSGRSGSAGLNSKTIAALERAIFKGIEGSFTAVQELMYVSPKSYEIEVVGHAFQSWLDKDFRYHIMLPMPDDALEERFIALEYYKNEENMNSFHKKDIFVVNVDPEFSRKSREDARMVAFIECKDGMTAPALGWLVRDPSNYSWIMPFEENTDASPIPLKRKKSGSYDSDVAIVGPVASVISSARQSPYEQKRS